MSRAQKRCVVDLLKDHGVSERHACRILQAGRSAYRRNPVERDDKALRSRLRDLAGKHKRFGYRRLNVLINRETHVNHKKLYRLYTEEGLKIRRRRGRNRAPVTRGSLRPAECPNARWSMDFMSDSLYGSTVFRVLNLVDDCTREALAMEPDFSLPGLRVIRVLNQIIELRGKPRQIVVDNGPEFTCKAMQKWAMDMGVDLHFIDKGKPNQNAFVESFNGKVRDELLNCNWFKDIMEVRARVEEWRRDYNTQRPHSSLGYLTPEEFALQQQVA